MGLSFRQSRTSPDLRSVDGFSRFYESHSKNLLRFFARRIGIPESALDLTAETFAAAFLSRRRFRGNSEEEATAWLYAIARAQLAAYRRRGVTEKQALRRLGIEVPELSLDDHERIEEMIDADAVIHAAKVGLRDLSDAERDAVRLRVIDERPYHEVAERLGITQDAARARVSRALRSLEIGLIQLDCEKEAVLDEPA